MLDEQKIKPGILLRATAVASDPGFVTTVDGERLVVGPGATAWVKEHSPEHVAWSTWRVVHIPGGELSDWDPDCFRKHWEIVEAEDE